MDEATCVEIEIRSYMVNGSSAAPDLRALEDAARRGAAEVVFAEDLVAEIDAARAAGARVLFVRVGGPGGHSQGSFQILDALRRFSAAGGKVVTYACAGRVASTATILALAGDFRFMHPAAVYLLHSTLGGEAAAAEWNPRMFEVYAARTSTPRAVLEQALRCTYTADGTLEAAELRREAALAFQWAHLDLDEAAARAMAAQLAAPEPRIEVVREHRRADAAAEIAAGAIVADKIAAQAIVAAKIATGAVTADKIEAGAVTAEKIAADAIKTSNFTSTGSGASEVATAGAKMQKDGTALLVTAGGLKIGTRVVDEYAPFKLVGQVRISDRFVGANSKGLTTASRETDGSGYFLRINFATDRATGDAPILSVVANGYTEPLIVRWQTLAASNPTRITRMDVWIYSFDSSGSLVALDPNSANSAAWLHILATRGSWDND
jgi:hypothetical protein